MIYCFSTYLCSLFLSLLWWCYLIPIWKVQCSWYIVSCYYVSIRMCFIDVVSLTCFIIVPMLYSWNLCKQLVWSKLVCLGWCLIALPKFVHLCLLWHAQLGRTLAFKCFIKLAHYSLRPKILVILGILRQINKKVKWPCLPLYIIHIWH